MFVCLIENVIISKRLKKGLCFKDRMAESEHMQVKVGVDLNPTKSPNDKKTYRHLTLLNGIECILVSQPFETEGSYDEDTDDEESSIASSSVSSSTASFSKDDINKQSSRKRSAVAVAVNVGSWSDPDGCHGKSF